MPFGNVRNLVSDYGSQLVLVIKQRQQSGVDVDRPVGKGKRIGSRIAQSAKLPFDVFEVLMSDDRHADTSQVSVQIFLMKDRAFLFEALVEQFDLAEQILIYLPKDELFFNNRLEDDRLRRGDAWRTCGTGGE